MGAQELAAIVRTYRQQRGWSQTYLATQVGMSQAFISRLEAGDYQTADPPRLQKLADVLGAPLAEFLAAVGVTAAPYRPAAPPPAPPPAPETRATRGMAWLWERLTPEEQTQVEDYARWLHSRHARRPRRSSAPPTPPSPDPEAAPGASET